MKKLLLSLGLLLGLASGASAQCVGVGSVVNVPQPGIVCVEDSIVATYAATSIGLVPGAAPTDIACLTGSATKIVRLKHVEVSGTAGTAINISVVLTKHASANTGGTPATTTALPVPYALDSGFATVTATTAAWTANPTINDAAPGIIGTKTVFLPATATAASAGFATWDFQANNGSISPPVLRGVAQQICVNLNGVTTPSSGLMTVNFVWTEQTQ